MPASPEMAADLARATVELYANLEQRLITTLAGQLARGIASPDWVADKLATVRIMLNRTRTLLIALDGPRAAAIREAIAAAWDRGGAAAVADLARVGLTGVPTLENAAAVDALTRERIQVLDQTQWRILRHIEDAYRGVVAAVAAEVNAGVDTRLRVAQRALNRLVARGVTGFVDRAGRRWDLASYVEMAMRTATGRAAVQAHTQRLQRAGLELVWVSDAPQECPVCRPWEGKVLALSGPPGRREVGGVQIAGTLDEARTGGFQHPNCRHSVSAYVKGATRLPVDTEDEQGNADRVRLRELEVQLRRWKRQAAAAMDPTADSFAAARVAEVQAAIREHVETTTAKRQSQRERIGTAR